MARVTRVGGELLIADIPGNSDMDKARHHDALEKLCDPTHVRCLSAEIERIFEDNNAEDRIGLEPRQENGVMMFTHQTVVYVLEKVAA